MLSGLQSKESNQRLGGTVWYNHNACPITTSMIATEDVGVKIIKEYFEIEVSKATP